MEYGIVCNRCGHTEGERAFRCSRCNSVLEVKIDYSTVKLGRGFRKSAPRQSKYLPFFPISRLDVRDDEKATPIAKVMLGGSSAMLKLETENPTHSFKDRGSSVEISKAVELGFRSVCAASTGNMGISIARYAHLAGLKATIFIGRGADRRKIQMIRMHGAAIRPVDGDFNTSLNLAEKFARRNRSTMLCGDYHFRKEGQKSVAFEIMDQLLFHVPDFIFIPVGNATLLSAVHKGLLEYRRFGFIARMPRLVAVQSKMCDPLIRAFNSGKRIEYMRPKTIADAIAVGYPTFGAEGLEALSRTRGIGIAVTEDEISEAVGELKRLGIKSEPGGAAGVAGLLSMLSSRPRLLSNKKIVAVVTGSN